MRRPRDYDAELRALDQKTRLLKDRRVRRLGELVIACKADLLTPEQLAGALVAAAGADAQVKEGWQKQGAAFFQRKTSGHAGEPVAEPDGSPPLGRAAPPAGAGSGTS